MAVLTTVPDLLRAFRELQIPPPRSTSWPAVLRSQAHLLEELLGRSWFLANPSHGQHPAQRRWDLCQRLLLQGSSFRIPHDRDAIPLFAELFLDNFLLVYCTGGDPDTFSLGSFANYGDESVIRRIRGIMHSPPQFADLLVEFAAAGWHITKDHTVMASEATGGADLIVTAATFPTPLALECKRLMAKSRLARIGALLKKANAQIKHTNPEFLGMAVLNVSSQVPHPEEFSDALPARVLEIREAVECALSTQNRSVSAALIVWDDFLLDEEYHNLRAWVVLRRRSLLVRHRSPRVPLPPDTSEFEIANTVEFGIRMAPEP